MKRTFFHLHFIKELQLSILLSKWHERKCSISTRVEKTLTQPLAGFQQVHWTYQYLGQFVIYDPWYWATYHSIQSIAINMIAKLFYHFSNNKL